MPYSDYRPDLMGAATLSPAGALEAGSYQSFELVYSAGAFGIDDTGSIKIGFRFATDFGPVQFDDPTAPGYTTVKASNGATLDCKWEFKRNIRPWSRSLYIGVMKHFLKPADTLTIRFGDRRQGSPGIRLQTYCEDEFAFRVFVDAIATYDYVPLPDSPKIAIVPGPPASWQAVLPTRVRAGEPFRLGIKATDKWGNISNRASGLVTLDANGSVIGLPDAVTFTDGEFYPAIEGLSVAAPGELQIVLSAVDGRELCRSNPLTVVGTEAPLVHFWGDTHGQSNETLGTNSAERYFAFGRDRALLDVIGHQGNDFQITDKFWRDLNALTQSFDKAGRFVCIPGYEWSANTAVGGDRNVHFHNEGETIHRSSHAQIWDGDDKADAASDAHDADALFAKLAGRDCVVVAHVGGRYADITLAHDGRLETAVEVHSAWGTFEWILHDAFECGYRLGVVCNSDGHKGRPGADFPGASFFGATGGLTCFLAARLDRDSIFTAMRERRHYGTTGNRMLLDVKVELEKDAERYRRDPAVFPDERLVAARELLMGDIARVSQDAAEVAISIAGSAPIERVDLFDGCELIETVRPYSESDLGARIRIIYEGAEYRGRARTSVWDGHLSLVDNAIEHVQIINNWNLDRGIQSQSSQQATWKAVTTGNFGGLDLVLADARSGVLNVETKLATLSIPISEIGLTPHVVEAGALARRLSVYRLPERLTSARMSIRRRLAVRQEGDTRLYVRVTQEDGHRAWSSPIYLFR
jgi:hypothetical protein